jgi:hypothetical protein
MEHPDGRRIVFPYHPEVDRYTLKGAVPAGRQIDSRGPS